MQIKHQNLMETAKAVLRGKFLALNVYVCVCVCVCVCVHIYVIYILV